MSKMILAGLGVLLAGCTHRPETREVPVPVSVPCLKEIPEEPTYIFETLPAATSEVEAAEQARILYRDFKAAELYGQKWKASASGCLAGQPSKSIR